MSKIRIPKSDGGDALLEKNLMFWGVHRVQFSLGTPTLLAVSSLRRMNSSGACRSGVQPGSFLPAIRNSD